ncbi:hypothetical protein F5Y12DRAFT_724807 [Xylaria sp. FL1777]|nr:hypothetical protein F5Y12DRAFT_724807 [Xylaria sp. FL1777]
MDSSQLKSFNKWWKDRLMLMVGQHYDEKADAKADAQAERESARENAQLQLDSLRNRAIDPTDLNDEVRKIKEDRDAILKSIDERLDERMRIIEKSQRKELENHEKAHEEALAERSFRNRTSPVHPSAPSTTATTTTTTTTATTEATGTATRESTTSTSQAPANPSSRPPNDQIPSTEDATPVPAAFREQHGSTMPEKGFSATLQPLQKSLNPRAKRPLCNDTVAPLPTPVSKDSSTGNELGTARTITFNEVYQNGQGKHKDTIVKFPVDGGKWYILKCEEHAIRFNRKPMAGAAKHLGGRMHGHLGRSYALAIEMLGYRVIDCDEKLAAINNKAVDEAFRNGYVPISINNPETRKARQKQTAATHTTQEVSDNLNQKTETITVSQGRGPPSQTSIKGKDYLSSRGPPKALWMTSKEIITNPKAFHVYYCFWSPESCEYPVMILGWDDQKPGGLEHGLVDTGLLDRKKSTPPRCYVYKDIDGIKNAAIAGWSPGFEDGGPMVNRRKFPVMFFDENSNVGWVSAKCLSKFPLYKLDPPKEEDHPFNTARRWIAKKEGFSSWEEFERAQKGSVREMGRRSVSTPLVSPITDSDSSGNDSDCSTRSSISNVTKKELQDMRDTAGEIDGDDDYTNSDVDSSASENEYDVGETLEADGRPWAFYGLRNVDCAKTGPCDNSVRKTTTTNTLVALPTHETTKKVYTQEDGYSAKDPTLEILSPDEYLKGNVENPTHDNEDKTSSRTSTRNLDVAHVFNQATSPFEGPVSLAHTAQADDKNRAEGGLSTLVHTSTGLPSASSSPVTQELETISKGLKRARSKEITKMDTGVPGQENAKKAKLGMDTSGNQVVKSTALEPPFPSASRVVHSFLPSVPLKLVAFELSFYRKGSLSWNRESEGSSIELYYQEGGARVATVHGLLNVVIDPKTLRGFTKEEIPGSKGNSIVTLLAKDPGDAPVKVVFDRARGSKMDIGKIQVRSFARWLRMVVPTLPQLEPGEKAENDELSKGIWQAAK